MTTISPALPADETPSAASAPPEHALWRRLDRFVEWMGEKFNPILVKETRQALKSRQFTVTFALVLLSGWVWSMLGVAWIGPHIHYGSEGPEMFFGYYMILAFPMAVIVPFQAFRSLASEREDGTYELLSITTLKPWQIVSGKLGSAVLQMIVYFSALAPCLAFTYMLRGIDFPTILILLFYTFFGSLGLSLVGLVAATAANQRHWQVMLSLVLLVGLLFAFWGACGAVYLVLSEAHLPLGELEFWLGNAVLVTVYVSYVALFFCAASAQLTFASDNRSTPLRYVMLAQMALFTAWFAWPFVEILAREQYFIYEMMIAYMVIVGFHWYAMGALMIGESGEISNRVKRRLPQSFMGRALLTWFNPGPRTGYMFAVASLASALAVVAIACLIAMTSAAARPLTFGRGVDPEAVMVFGLLGFSYLVIYLGIGNLILGLARRFAPVTMVLSLLLQVVLLLIGCGGPLMFHWMNADMRSDYSLIEITNPVWTLYEVADSMSSISTQLIVLLIFLPATALFVFLANLPGVLREVQQVRVAAPVRVQEEDAEREAIRHPVQPIKKNPWDEPAVAEG